MSTIAPAKASVTTEVGRAEIVFETGRLAKQADGAVVVSSGDTMVLATAQGRLEAREGADFFPLTVDVEATCPNTVLIPCPPLCLWRVEVWASLAACGARPSFHSPG